MSYIKWFEDLYYYLKRQRSKAPLPTLTLSSLTTRHLVPRMHCIVNACQQRVHVQVNRTVKDLL